MDIVTQREIKCKARYIPISPRFFLLITKTGSKGRTYIYLEVKYVAGIVAQQEKPQPATPVSHRGP